MRRLRVVLAALFAVSPLFSGQASAAPIKASEAKKVFFGLDMSGIFQPDGSKWRECIDPKGTTGYWFDGTFDRGRLRVREDGALCFSYAETGYQREGCYTAERRGAGWKFVNVTDPAVVFLADRAVKVKTCPAENAAIS